MCAVSLPTNCSISEGKSDGNKSFSPSCFPVVSLVWREQGKDRRKISWKFGCDRILMGLEVLPSGREFHFALEQP